MRAFHDHMIDGCTREEEVNMPERRYISRRGQVDLPCAEERERHPLCVANLQYLSC